MRTETQRPLCTLPVLGDETIDPPLFSKVDGAKNWMAILTENKEVPGGFARAWLKWNTTNGKVEYDAGSIKLHDVVECGADTFTGNGSRIRFRWYGVVIRRTSTEIEVEVYRTPSPASRRAAALKEAALPPSPPAPQTEIPVTTQSDIRTWLNRGIKAKATHMIVVTDTFDHDDYPVYVRRGESPEQVAETYRVRPMQKVMEVYALRLNLDEQLAETRSFHYEPAPETNP